MQAGSRLHPLAGTRCSAHACRAPRAPARSCRAAVLKRRGALADPVSEDDISRALKKLKVLGGGIDLVTIGRGAYVRSVPGELNLDKNRALELAQVGGVLHGGACGRAHAGLWACSAFGVRFHVQAPRGTCHLRQAGGTCTCELALAHSLAAPQIKHPAGQGLPRAAGALQPRGLERAARGGLPAGAAERGACYD